MNTASIRRLDAVARTSALGAMGYTAASTVGALILHLPGTASHDVPMNSAALENSRRTTSGLPVHLAVSDNEPSNSTELTQETLSELRRLSGLTWDQLANLFQVSRRTLHFWASGQALSKAHEETLHRLVGTVRFIDRGSASLNRNLLLSPDDDFQLSIDLLAAGKYEEVKQRLGEGQALPKTQVAALSETAIASRLPPPPADLVDALQDPVHREVGRSKPAQVVRNRKHDANQ